jgi:uncharacterized protein (TIGR00251 family)
VVPNGVRIDVRVMPRSPQVKVGPVRDGRLMVRVTAPPVDGAANEAVINALATFFDVGRRAVRVVAGETGRNKTVEIGGLSASHIAARIGDV